MPAGTCPICWGITSTGQGRGGSAYPWEPTVCLSVPAADGSVSIREPESPPSRAQAGMPTRITITSIPTGTAYDQTLLVCWASQYACRHRRQLSARAQGT